MDLLEDILLNIADNMYIQTVSKKLIFLLIRDGIWKFKPIRKSKKWCRSSLESRDWLFVNTFFSFGIDLIGRSCIWKAISIWYSPWVYQVIHLQKRRIQSPFHWNRTFSILSFNSNWKSLQEKSKKKIQQEKSPRKFCKKFPLENKNEGEV